MGLHNYSPVRSRSRDVIAPFNADCIQIFNGLEYSKLFPISCHSRSRPSWPPLAYSCVQANIRIFSGWRISHVQLALPRQSSSLCTCQMCMVCGGGRAALGTLGLCRSGCDRRYFLAFCDLAICGLYHSHIRQTSRRRKDLARTLQYRSICMCSVSFWPMFLPLMSILVELTCLNYRSVVDGAHICRFPLSCDS